MRPAQILLILSLMIGHGQQVLSNYPKLPVKNRSGIIQIDGRSTIGNFRLEYSFSDSASCSTVEEDCTRDNVSCLIIPASEFTSKAPKLERDFCSLVKSELYPNIAIGFQGFSVAFSEQNSIEDHISISLAGITRTYEVTYDRSIRGDNTMLINGSLLIPFSDFGLDPPSRFLGLVKVNEAIRVSFSVNFTLDSNLRSPS